MKRKSLFASAAITVAAAFMLSACGGSGTQSGSEPTASESSSQSADAEVSAASGTLTVFAAASLNQAFPEIAETVFNAQYPGVQVSFSFDGSKSLVEQIAAGAPADVFASADEKNMVSAQDQDLVTSPTLFAENILTIVTPADNPGQITGLDESLDGKKLVICAEGVPCGNATKTLASNLGVTLTPVSEEQSVTDVLGKIENGQADAGLVYVTDAKSAGDKVKTISIEGAEEVVNSYMIAPVAEGTQQDLAQAFIDAVLSSEGQAILADYGFVTVS